MRVALLLALLAPPGCAGPPETVPTAMGGSGELSVPGGTLYFEVRGAGPAVVLIHGGFGDRRMWDLQLEDLARRFVVVRYDHRGFGRSTAPNGPYSAVDDLRRLLDHLHLDRAHLVGNSMGGTLALDFALRYPERVRRLVLVAAGPGGYPFPEADRRRVGHVFDTAAKAGVAAAEQLWLDDPMVQVARAHPVAGPRLATMVRENRQLFLLTHWPEEPGEPPAMERLSLVEVPTLVVVGERDTPANRAAARAAADGIRGARLVTLPGTDHLPQLEQPTEFNHLLRSFLQGR